MAEFIKREDLLKLYDLNGVETEGLKVPLEVVIQNIKDMPSADVVELELSPVCFNCDGKTTDGVRTEQCLWVKGDNSKCIAQAQKLLDVVERKKGKWISMMGHSICNVCGYKGSPIPANFCPNCGAEMRGGEDDKDI